MQSKYLQVSFGCAAVCVQCCHYAPSLTYKLLHSQHNTGIARTVGFNFASCVIHRTSCLMAIATDIHDGNKATSCIPAAEALRPGHA